MNVVNDFASTVAGDREFQAFVTLKEKKFRRVFSLGVDLVPLLVKHQTAVSNRAVSKSNGCRCEIVLNKLFVYNATVDPAVNVSWTRVRESEKEWKCVAIR